MSIKIYTEYKCRKGHKWHKTWRSYPWFDDYSTNCPKCGQSTWPHSSHATSYERRSNWKRHDN
jgi:hypothetical protein